MPAPITKLHTEPAPGLVSPRAPKRLGERLLEAGHISQTQLDLALREQKRRGGLIGQVMVGLGFVSQETISAFVAKESETRFVNVNRCVIRSEERRVGKEWRATVSLDGQQKK